MSNLTAAAYYNSGFPGLLDIKKPLGIENDDFKFNMILSIYAAPNIVFALLSGFVIDKLGAVRFYFEIKIIK